MTAEEMGNEYVRLVATGMSESQAVAELDREIAVRAIIARNRRLGQPDREITDEEILQQLAAM